MIKPRIEIRTKRIGGHKLKKIVTVLYEKGVNCEEFIDSGWYVSIRECGKLVLVHGRNKKEAKDKFEKEFKKNLRSFKDLLKC